MVSPMPTLRYLAYGSNLLPARLFARVGAVPVLGPVALPGFALAFSKRGADGSGKCTLAASASDTAWGAVFELARTACAELDRIEGLGRGYRAHWLECRDFGPCYTYIAEPAWCDAALRPFDWYRDLVEAGARYHSFPADYVGGLAAVATCPDPDRARAAAHRALLGSLA